MVEPTKEWIENAKKENGKIYKVVLSGETYVYRPLKRSEYKELQKLVQPEMTPQGPVVPPEQQTEVEEKTAIKCVLWPEDFADKDDIAGAATMLSTFISNSSGFEIEEPPVEL